MRVLHVSEALGGGVTSAVVAMVDATPEVDHHLLAAPRRDHDIGVEPDRHFTTVSTMATNPVAAMRHLHAVVRDVSPDVVHAHSSIAGVVVRAAGLDRPRIVYSPHCFAFERRDVGGLSRRAFRAVEKALASRTDLFLAVAPQELELAAELGHRAMAYVPNRAAIDPEPVATFERPLRIMTVGRICPQKDWRYLVHLKRFVDEHVGLRASWEWLGDGDADGEAALRDAGVEVTGWMSRDAVLDRLAQAQVYVHTAAWEAAPISILEAASLGLPMAVRSIPSLDSLALPGLAPGVTALAERVAALADEALWHRASDDSLALAARHSPAAQGRHLVHAYRRALGETTPSLVSSVPSWANEARVGSPLRPARGLR